MPLERVSNPQKASKCFGGAHRTAGRLNAGIGRDAEVCSQHARVLVFYASRAKPGA
jgi:hypothetical protein